MKILVTTASKLGWVERTITKMGNAPDGDYRDFDAIRGWAGEIAEHLLAAPR